MRNQAVNTIEPHADRIWRAIGMNSLQLHEVAVAMEANLHNEALQEALLARHNAKLAEADLLQELIEIVTLDWCGRP